MENITEADLKDLWVKEKTLIKGKQRQTVRHRIYDIVKRRRTFNGLRTVRWWYQPLQEYISGVKKNINVLEIGSHEGQSTSWFLQNIINKHSSNRMICIDPQFKTRWRFNGALAYSDVFEINMEKHNKDKNQLKLFKKLSFDFFEKDKENYINKIDVIYVDGSHEYPDVLKDIVNCDDMLKKGGVMIIDDYDATYCAEEDKTATKNPSSWCDPVKKAVEEFLQDNDRYEVIHRRYQIIIKKKN